MHTQRNRIVIITREEVLSGWSRMEKYKKKGGGRDSFTVVIVIISYFLCPDLLHTGKRGEG